MSNPAPYGQCIAALEYMAQAVFAGDLSALQHAALTWAKDGNDVILGEKTWADLDLPLIVFGGSPVSAPLRERPVRPPLAPPRAGDPFLTVLDHEQALEIVKFAARRGLSEAGFDYEETDHLLLPDFLLED